MYECSSSSSKGTYKQEGDTSNRHENSKNGFKVVMFDDYKNMIAMGMFQTLLVGMRFTTEDLRGL